MKKLIYLFISLLTVAPFCHSGYTEAVVTDGLVSYWTFDRQDIADNTVIDVWGKNDATIVGDPQAVAGRVKDALEFDGVDDYVNLTNLEPVYLGAGNNRGKAEDFFHGIIDEVRIYNRPLTYDEVLQNFEIGLDVKPVQKLPTVWGTLKTRL